LVDVSGTSVTGTAGGIIFVDAMNGNLSANATKLRGNGSGGSAGGTVLLLAPLGSMNVSSISATSVDAVAGTVNLYSPTVQLTGVTFTGGTTSIDVSSSSASGGYATVRGSTITVSGGDVVATGSTGGGYITIGSSNGSVTTQKLSANSIAFSVTQ